MPNPKRHDIILIDRTEVGADGRGSFLKVYDMVGNTFRIAEKRSQLWDVFRNAKKAEPVLVTFETYRNIEYISNAQSIVDDILKQAVSNLGLKVVDKQNEERNRSTSLSYAKDMLCADKIETEKLFEQAQDNYQFIKGVPTNTSEEEKSDAKQNLS